MSVQSKHLRRRQSVLVRLVFKPRCGCFTLLTQVQVNIRVIEGPYFRKGQADGASIGPGEESEGRNGLVRKGWSQF